MLSNIKKANRLVDRAISLMTLSNQEKQEILEEVNIKSRLEKANSIINRETQRIKLGEEIQTEVHDEIAKTIGKKRVTISNALRLLKLPPEIRKSIRNGKISAGHGRAILQKKTTSAMHAFWKKIIDESFSVRAAEAHAKPVSKTKKIKKLKIQKGPIRSIEDQLIEIFGTKVKLKPSQVGGSIEIVYFSDDDLERIIDLLQSL